MKMPKNIQEVIGKQDLYVISTSSKDGMPNTIYVKFLKVYNDEQVVIADNKFSKTENNLQENPKMSFVVLDRENKKSYQVKGSVEVQKEGAVFDEVVKWVEEKRSGPMTNAKAAVLLNVEEIYSGAEKITEE
jgi:predicted pyridoxine 5'-phosphate oxidase superfamily flavin-nucleotide-binding protein